LNNLKNNNGGFIQGNFSPKSLLKPHKMFIEDFNNFIEQMKTLDQKQRSGWVCSLNHGVLPKTPEENVRYFIETIRSVFSGNS
jgi:uroporphyrinogen decarboxylase